MQTAHACASCGSGGDSPLILYPNEEWKFYLGTSFTGGYVNILPDGSHGTDNGPQLKDSVLFSFGHSFSPRFFLTFTDSYLQNRSHGRSQSSWGDPLVSARYTLIPQSIEDDRVPQIQAMVAYKYPATKALQEATDANYLDAFGNGVSEIKLGLDLWYGMSRLKGGIAHVVTFPSHAHFAQNLTVEPGVTQRSTLTLGLSHPFGKILVGYNLEMLAPLRVNGDEVADSREVNHSLFTTLDFDFADVGGECRLTISQRGVGPWNKNTSQATVLSLGWLQVL